MSPSYPVINWHKTPANAMVQWHGNVVICKITSGDSSIVEGHHWFGWYLVAFSEQIHYLNRCVLSEMELHLVTVLTSTNFKLRYNCTGEITSRCLDDSLTRWVGSDGRSYGRLWSFITPWGVDESCAHCYLIHPASDPKSEDESNNSCINRFFDKPHPFRIL